MPKRLKDRWRPESVREFRAAARVRYDDGLELYRQGRMAGAIYVWGYCAEMTLKAAYFSLPLAETEPITWKEHIGPAIENARSRYLIKWHRAGAGHNVAGWAELLVVDRAERSAAYGPEVARSTQEYAQMVGLLRSESSRYHSNVAYRYEADQVQDAVEWLMAFFDAERK